jgi:prephenate dehydratase
MPPRPTRPRVAYQGEPGAYSEDATVTLFGEDIETLPCIEFRDAFEAVDTGAATHAVLPVENSIEGTVAQVNDLLLEHDLTVTGETLVEVNHCLIGRPGSSLRSLRTVYSHPQALGQCRRFLTRHADWRQVPTYDTAGSVKLVRERGRKDEAAIASRRSASMYRMKVLAEDIQTDHENATRFFVLEKHPREVPAADKTSIAFVAKNVPGALYRCLGEFATRDINLTKLESRPRRARPWNYVFYADLEGTMAQPKVRDAVGALVATAGLVKVFGSYRRAAPPHARSSGPTRHGPSTGRTIRNVG